MRDRKALLGLLGLFFVILVVLTFSRRSNPTATAGAIAIAFGGYTNSPTGRRFALFTVSNRAGYATRWRGDWVEIEGSQNHQGRITNPSLPGSTYGPVLRAGASLTLAVGEPNDVSETVPWRFAMSFSRYTVQERWLEFSFRHKLPLGIGSFVIVDSQQILSPSNRITVTTDWVTK
jgi:hypothetical protein